MDKLRMTGSPWRSWTAIAFVLLTLAVIQACDSGRHTGPSTTTALQLKLHRVGGAEIPAGCTGVYSVTGPGVNIQNAALPANGQISFQGQVGPDLHGHRHDLVQWLTPSPAAPRSRSSRAPTRDDRAHRQQGDRRVVHAQSGGAGSDLQLHVQFPEPRRARFGWTGADSDERQPGEVQ